MYSFLTYKSHGLGLVQFVQTFNRVTVNIPMILGIVTSFGGHIKEKIRVEKHRSFKTHVVGIFLIIEPLKVL